MVADSILFALRRRKAARHSSLEFNRLQGFRSMQNEFFLGEFLAK